MSSYARPCATAAVAISLAIATAGCDSARSGGAGQLLTPNATGWVDRSTTGTTGIQGPWYTFTDRDDCLPRHAAAECSTFVPPDLGSPTFPPTGGLGMCAVGVAAKVIPGPDGLDYSAIWGARIGFNLNEGEDYDAPAHGVTGLAFHIDAEPAWGAGLQIILPTATSNIEAAWWGGATAPTSPVHAGRNEIRWADVGGPDYMKNPPPPPFDPKGLRAIQFGVKVDDLVAKSFAFCIDELTALTD